MIQRKDRKTQYREMTDLLSCYTLIQNLHSSRTIIKVQNKKESKNSFFIFTTGVRTRGKSCTNTQEFSYFPFVKVVSIHLLPWVY